MLVSFLTPISDLRLPVPLEYENRQLTQIESVHIKALPDARRSDQWVKCSRNI